jgi:hypothetical protein
LIIKSCSCGSEYDAHSWERLPLVGHMHVAADEEGPATVTELRNCSCSSTIGIETEKAS